MFDRDLIFFDVRRINMFHDTNGVFEVKRDKPKSFRLRVTEIDKSVVSNAFPGNIYPRLYLNVGSEIPVTRCIQENGLNQQGRYL